MTEYKYLKDNEKVLLISCGQNDFVPKYIDELLRYIKPVFTDSYYRSNLTGIEITHEPMMKECFEHIFIYEYKTKEECEYIEYELKRNLKALQVLENIFKDKENKIGVTSDDNQ